MKRMMFAALLFTIAAHARADEELRVLASQLGGVTAGNLLEVYLKQQTLDQAVNVVHGALQRYDLSDLIDLAGADKTVLEEPVDVLGEPLRGKAE